MKINKLILILFSFIFITSTNLYSQNCYREDYGFDEAAEDGDNYYEFEDGSYYGYAEGGDTIMINTVLYGKRKYKIFVKTLNDLQIASWKIIQNKKSTTLIKKTRNEKYEYTYKLNDKGEYLSEDGKVLDEFGRKKDKNGEIIKENGRAVDFRVVTNRVVVSADTIFSREVINEEIEIYSGSEGSEMVKKNKKAKSVVIKLIFAEGETGGCYGVFIGNQRSRSKKAGKNW
jgi:hypothetical protein